MRWNVDSASPGGVESEESGLLDSRGSFVGPASFGDDSSPSSWQMPREATWRAPRVGWLAGARTGAFVGVVSVLPSRNGAEIVTGEEASVVRQTSSETEGNPTGSDAHPGVRAERLLATKFSLRSSQSPKGA